MKQDEGPLPEDTRCWFYIEKWIKSRIRCLKLMHHLMTTEYQAPINWIGGPVPFFNVTMLQTFH